MSKEKDYMSSLYSDAIRNHGPELMINMIHNPNWKPKDWDLFIRDLDAALEEALEAAKQRSLRCIQWPD